MSRRHLPRRRAPVARSRNLGVSLIELMVALVLGLLVSGAAIAMFISNSQTYRATESMSRVQENARIAFELMARDIREAGGTPCSRNVPVITTLNNPTANWWSNWNNGLIGYENGALPGSLAGTDAIELLAGSSTGVSVASHNPTAASMHVTPGAHGFVADDILMVCDYRQASIFQMSGPNANPITNGNIVHNTGSGSPGNCTKGLGFPLRCTTNGSPYTYGDNSVVVRLQASRWFVAANGRGGNSLFRVALRNSGPGAAEEVIEGVNDMRITYLLPGAGQYQPASAIPATRWREVMSVRLELDLDGQEAVGTDRSSILRGLQHTVNIRNRTA
jgi:type IV pilus assembly protein PilW